MTRAEALQYFKRHIDLYCVTGVSLDLEIAAIKSLETLDDLEKQIALLKRSIKSENSDYLTGYLCALSAVEGIIMESEVDE